MHYEGNPSKGSVHVGYKLIQIYVGPGKFQQFKSMSGLKCFEIIVLIDYKRSMPIGLHVIL